MIRIFVGCAANHEDAESQAVLEWSIRKHASLPVDITWMKMSRDPKSPFYCDPANGKGWQSGDWVTPFSGFRWSIPEQCGFEGRAIYTDSDIIYFADIAEFWSQPMDGRVVLAKEAGGTRFCVSLWDCAAARKHIAPLAKLMADPQAHRQTTGYFGQNGKVLVGKFEGSWNTHDKEAFPDLHSNPPKSFHYTNIATQPQLRHALKRLKAAGLKHWYDGVPRDHARKDVIEVFDALLAEAKANGYGPERYCQDEPFGAYKKRSLSRHR